MKTVIFSVAFIALSQLVAAQPRGVRHRHLHAKRDVVTNYATVTSPEVIVWIDQQGNTVSVETKNAIPVKTAYLHPHSAQMASSVEVVPTLAPTQAAAAPPSSSSTSQPQTTSAVVAPASVATTTSASSSSPTPTTSGSSSSSNQGSMLGLGVGITYSPYNGDGTCKTQDQVNTDFNQMNGYQIVRMYGVDCNQVTTILSAAKSKGMKVFAGIIDITNVSGDLSTLISGVSGDWSIIETVAIGNELVNQGKNSVGDVVAAVQAARKQLTAAGFTGSVVTVDTFNAIISNPELCTVSDYCAANCHAFFNSDVEASGAGAFVLEQAKLVSKAAGGKNTIITESGWPSQGDSNGAAVPSEENQAAAIASLKGTFSGNLFVFNAFNDLWKKNGPGTFNAEQYWGIMGTSSS